MANAIEFENVSKQYRLGLVGTGTLAHDLRRFWIRDILRQEDPYLKIGETNDRASKGSSDYVWALRDITFNVEQGDVVGIIGKNGAGKSTLLKLLSRVTGPTTGTIRAHGRIGSLLEVGTGFHPEMTGRENIFMNGAILGMTRAEIQRKLDEIVDFSGCERYIDTPVKRYSSGMMVRLGFAVAAHLDPEILVVDEVLAVGDAEFQKKAIGKMQDVSKGEGRTVLFVSHNMGSVRQLCNHGIMLENGQVKSMGEVNTIVEQYLTSSVDLSFGSGDFNIVDSEENKIKYIHFFNARGERVNEFYTGDDVMIEICVQNCDFMEDMGVGLYFKDGYGNKIAGTTSFINPLVLNVNEKQKDRVYRTTIKNLTLTEGKYSVELGLAIRNGERKDGRDSACAINIFAGKPEVSSFMGNSYIDTIWTVQ